MRVKVAVNPNIDPQRRNERNRGRFLKGEAPADGEQQRRPRMRRQLSPACSPPVQAALPARVAIFDAPFGPRYL